MLGLAKQNDSHWEGGKRRVSGREMRDDILVPLLKGPYNSEPVYVRVCPGPGGPSLRASGSLFASESMRGTPWRGPGSLLCDLIWRVPGPPFPHSARCAVKHGVGEEGEKRQKGPILSTLHGLDSRDISPTPKPFQSSVHFLQHLCCGTLLHNVHSLLFTGEAPLQSICSFPPFHSFFTESSFSPLCFSI